MRQSIGLAVAIAISVSLSTSFLNGIGEKAGEDAWRAIKNFAQPRHYDIVSAPDYGGVYVSAPDYGGVYTSPRAKGTDYLSYTPSGPR